MQKYDPVVFGDSSPVRVKDGVFQPAEKPLPAKIQPISAADLDAKEIEPLEWIVHDLIPEGLTMLSAPPKSYKSFFALQLCCAVCTGRPFLGHQVEKGACLYLDLESGERRPRDRLRMILGEDAPKPDNLFFITGESDPGRIGAGLEEQLLMQFNDIMGLRLIVIDVLQYIKPPAKKNSNSYESDYAAYKVLAQICRQTGCSIMVINHLRKDRGSSDAFANVVGSTANLGAVDCGMVIQLERFETEARLAVTGRDVQAQELSIRFDQGAMQWRYLGEADQLRRDAERNEYDRHPVVIALRRMLDTNEDQWAGTCKELLAAAQAITPSVSISETSVGQYLRKHEQELRFYDGIVAEWGKNSKDGRRHKFTRFCPFEERK